MDVSDRPESETERAATQKRATKVWDTGIRTQKRAEERQESETEFARRTSSKVNCFGGSLPSLCEETMRRDGPVGQRLGVVGAAARSEVSKTLTFGLETMIDLIFLSTSTMLLLPFSISLPKRGLTRTTTLHGDKMMK